MKFVKTLMPGKATLAGLLLAVLVLVYYLYRQGKVSLWFQPPPEDQVVVERRVGIPFAEPEYRLSYGGQEGSSFEIASFEEGENWAGDGELDYAISFEGESSYFLSSNDHQSSMLTLPADFKIDEVVNFKFLIRLETDPGDLEELNLVFVDEDQGLNYEFAIRDLNKGWNLLNMPKKKFHAYTQKSQTAFDRVDVDGAETKIEKLVIELVSRPKTRSIVNLDSLWAEKEDLYLKNWYLEPEGMMSIRKNKNNDDFLIFNNGGTARAVLKKIGSAQDFTVQAKFTPLRSGRFALFLRGDYGEGDGYYLEMGGVGTDSWRVYKQGIFGGQREVKFLSEGRISNFQMEDKPCWLKVEAKGSELRFYFSLDGENFISLCAVDDKTYPNGAIGIATSGESLFFVDDFVFSQ